MDFNFCFCKQFSTHARSHSCLPLLDFLVQVLIFSKNIMFFLMTLHVEFHFDHYSFKDSHFQITRLWQKVYHFLFFFYYDIQDLPLDQLLVPPCHTILTCPFYTCLFFERVLLQNTLVRFGDVNLGAYYDMFCGMMQNTSHDSTIALTSISQPSVLKTKKRPTLLLNNGMETKSFSFCWSAHCKQKLPKSFNLCNVDLFDGTFTLKNGLA